MWCILHRRPGQIVWQTVKGRKTKRPHCLYNKSICWFSVLYYFKTRWWRVWMLQGRICVNLTKVTWQAHKPSPRSSGTQHLKWTRAKTETETFRFSRNLNANAGRGSVGGRSSVWSDAGHRAAADNRNVKKSYSAAAQGSSSLYRKVTATPDWLVYDMCAGF